MKNILEFGAALAANEPISMVTCYDYWSAKILNSSNIDCLLVGDSVAMVNHGYESTVNATVEMMVAHTQAVTKGASEKFIVSDLPFMSYRQGLSSGIAASTKLMQAGANGVKLEGSTGNEAIISHLVESGIPVMGHIGLTPQCVNSLGGFKVQGKSASSAEKIRSEAKQLESLGCFALVLECIPSELAGEITEQLEIPTIGIGAGCKTSGQVLVLQDLLGTDSSFNPRFLKQFENLERRITNAVNDFDQQVSNRSFPSETESYS